MQPLYRRPYHHHQRERGSLGRASDEPPRSLADLMQQLEGLEARVQQLKSGVANLLQLQQIQAETPPADTLGASQDLLTLQAAADRFELELASRVVAWDHLKEPFWQAVRFGGLGLVVGWVLAWLVYAQ